MKIDWNQEAAGLDLLQIRDILRFTCRSGMHFGVSSVASRIDLMTGANNFYGRDRKVMQEDSRKRAAELLDALVAGGVIGDPDPETLRSAGNGHPGYDLTPAGFGLLRATKTKRITRKAADLAVELLRKAIVEINANPVLMHDVERVAIYGSYLTDAADLGDVDVAYSLRPRWQDKEDKQRRKVAFEAVHLPPENQIGLRDYEYRWHEKVLTRMLRVKPCIQLTPMYHLAELGCPRLEILPADNLVPAKEGYSFQRSEIRLVNDGGEARRHLDARIMAAKV